MQPSDVKDLDAPIDIEVSLPSAEPARSPAMDCYISILVSVHVVNLAAVRQLFSKPGMATCWRNRRGDFLNRRSEVYEVKCTKQAPPPSGALSDEILDLAILSALGTAVLKL